MSAAVLERTQVMELAVMLRQAEEGVRQAMRDRTWEPTPIGQQVRAYDVVRSGGGALAERDGGRRDYEPPRVDKPAQVGTSRSASAHGSSLAPLYAVAMFAAIVLALIGDRL